MSNCWLDMSGAGRGWNPRMGRRGMLPQGIVVVDKVDCCPAGNGSPMADDVVAMLVKLGISCCCVGWRAKLVRGWGLVTPGKVMLERTGAGTCCCCCCC